MPKYDGKHIYKSNEYWVAFILEICASDTYHVYARVYWMYWPEDLPDSTLDGEKTVQGRQPYHGVNELIASNHMDIINVTSVIGPAIVNQWNESYDEEIQDAHYWRQGYDCRNSQLSSVELVCNCQTPANPDKTLIGCTNSERRRWMHHECVAHNILIKVYEQLGTDKPHRTEGFVVKEGKPEEATRPLSPTDAEETETQPTFHVRSGKTNDEVNAKKPARENPRETVIPTPGPTPPRSVATASAKGSAKTGRKNTEDSKPYLGLFEATLQMKNGLTAWEIRDLRENVTGGDKAWTEEAHCPCGSTIDGKFNMMTT
ncbi:Chromatin remodeling protein SHL [Fusarium oxysporum f. sp. rapae]|uniref:Chromatin remodeling protein SHL n=1 Tax=Fusarium oxysporum f. sp. rapae TaxID=485398 RepID=A0A8J5NH35_FUSOX|nr:Chromatin remodeling protein SHL [Fusarium oxysporum f. sp. rapae]KAG7403364.1 Chromatin remodeling protein SHL [Fusarium oxysporum f. sp. rapae]